MSMKRLFFSTLFLISLFWLCAPPIVLAAYDPTQDEPPKPSIQIPGFAGFSKISRSTSDNAVLVIPYIPQYLAAFYKWSVGAGAVIAAFMITVGGFQYVASAGVPKAIGAAKKRITNALIGFLLLLGSYVFLYAINPDFVNMKSIELLGVKTINLESDAEDPSSANTGGGGFAGTAVCTSIATCTELTNKPQNEWPLFNDKTVSPDDVEMIKGENILNPSSKKATSETIVALNEAAKIAGRFGYTLTITSGYRPLKDQILLAKNDIEKNSGVNLGSKIAWPGTSNHGTGAAVDVKLSKGSASITCAGYDSCDQKDPQLTNPAKQLMEIMSATGFKRLRKEIWHFELGTNSSGMCTSVTDCPFPPNM